MNTYLAVIASAGCLLGLARLTLFLVFILGFLNSRCHRQCWGALHSETLHVSEYMQRYCRITQWMRLKRKDGP